MADVSTSLSNLSYLGEPDYNSKILWISDSNFELLPVQSPLLRQSLLISFPPLINMLKSSGSSYLISGVRKAFGFYTAHKKLWLLQRAFTWWENFSHIVIGYLFGHTETSMRILSAIVAFTDPMIRGSAIHIAYRILAAFFIVMGAKTSIVENLKFYQPNIDLWFYF